MRKYDFEQKSAYSVIPVFVAIDALGGKRTSLDGEYHHANDIAEN